jgi:hypothetical protein
LVFCRVSSASGFCFWFWFTTAEIQKFGALVVQVRDFEPGQQTCIQHTSYREYWSANSPVPPNSSSNDGVSGGRQIADLPGVPPETGTAIRQQHQWQRRQRVAGAGAGSRKVQQDAAA